MSSRNLRHRKAKSSLSLSLLSGKKNMAPNNNPFTFSIAQKAQISVRTERIFFKTPVKERNEMKLLSVQSLAGQSFFEKQEGLGLDEKKKSVATSYRNLGAHNSWVINKKWELKPDLNNIKSELKLNKAETEP